jgi:hypothetical protein
VQHLNQCVPSGSAYYAAGAAVRCWEGECRFLLVVSCSGVTEHLVAACSRIVRVGFMSPPRSRCVIGHISQSRRRAAYSRYKLILLARIASIGPPLLPPNPRDTMSAPPSARVLQSAADCGSHFLPVPSRPPSLPGRYRCASCACAAAAGSTSTTDTQRPQPPARRRRLARVAFKEEDRQQEEEQQAQQRLQQLAHDQVGRACMRCMHSCTASSWRPACCLLHASEHHETRDRRSRCHLRPPAAAAAGPGHRGLAAACALASHGHASAMTQLASSVQ